MKCMTSLKVHAFFDSLDIDYRTEVVYTCKVIGILHDANTVANVTLCLNSCTLPLVTEHF